jgi:nicotinamidase-related amidase
MTTALVVIDMLNDFLSGGLANPAARRIVEPIAGLVERARGAPDWVVVYANDAHRPEDIELSVWPPHAMAGTPGAEVIDELAPGPDDLVVPKRFYSAFTESALEHVLHEAGVERMVLTGQHTDCCLRHTSYDAFRLGLGLAVCPDASAVYEPGSDEPVASRQERALDYLVTYYGATLVPSTEVL